MMERIPLVNVTARICDQGGLPIRRARVTMRLTTIERYMGLVVPREVSQYTDDNGIAVLSVWPNELGTEGSEYLCTIMYGSATSASSGQCGCNSDGSSYTQSQRFRVVVPNADCNLFDICDLPPYEQRGSGLVIAAEVASFANIAGNAADRSQAALQTVEAIQTEIQSGVATANAAGALATQAANQAQREANRAQAIVDSANSAIATFETAVVDRTERLVLAMSNDAQTRLGQVAHTAEEALEARAGEVLTEISQKGALERQSLREQAEAIKDNALFELEDKGYKLQEAMREEIALFGADFEALTERAESAAKRSGCSAASAANSATKACLCAERAEAASEGIDRYRDEILIAARQVETSQACIDASLMRAEAAADRVQQNCEWAAGSAKASQEAARAADCASQLAKESAEIAVNAQQAAKADKDACERAREIAESVALRADTVSEVAETAIKRVETAMVCAETAARSADKQAGIAKENALATSENARICKELEDACTWAAEKAITRADEAAKDADQVAKDRKAVEAINADVEKAIHDMALDLLTPQVVADAIEQATATAENAASRAEQSLELCKEQIDLCALEVGKAGAEIEKAKAQAERAQTIADSVENTANQAEVQAELARVRAERAEAAKTEAEEIAADLAEAGAKTLADANAAADRAEYEALKLVDAGRDPARIAGMFGQLMLMSDRLFKLELVNA